MKISLLHPSRGRPHKSLVCSQTWLGLSGVNTELIVSVDLSDPTLSTYLNFYNQAIVNDNISVVQATNEAAKKSRGDILVYLSDDFKCPDNWGQLILKEFEGVTTPQVLKIDDCLQQFHARVLTAPIMNRLAYNELGYFWNPLYKSMWVDCDLYETCFRRGWIKKTPHLKFPHEHVSNGKAPDDDTYRRSAANWDQGKSVFDMRKRNGFI